MREDHSRSRRSQRMHAFLMMIWINGEHSLASTRAMKIRDRSCLPYVPIRGRSRPSQIGPYSRMISFLVEARWLNVAMLLDRRDISIARSYEHTLPLAHLRARLPSRGIALTGGALTRSSTARSMILAFARPRLRSTAQSILTRSQRCATLVPYARSYVSQLS
jgi:hypothetical protein